MRVGSGSPTIQVRLPQSLTHLLRAQLDTHIAQGSFHTAHVHGACWAGAEQFEDILECWGWEGAGGQSEPMHRNPEIHPL